MTHAQPPVENCPKCGQVAAFRAVGPKWYDRRAAGYPYGHAEDHPRDEHLDWTCTRCGYLLPGPVLS